MCRTCEIENEAPSAHVCRWVCLCGNLISEKPQLPQLPSQTLRAVGECCAHVLPDSLKHCAMPLQNVENPRAGQRDQRAVLRPETDPGTVLGKESS